jgi:hypothetical protein
MDPDEVLNMMLRGEIPFLAEGGSVEARELAEKYDV